MNAAIAEIIIENERNSYRFEEFAREVCEANEGMQFFSTSATWDKGRDAKTIQPGRGSHRAVIAVTLNKGLDQKVDEDLLRLTATSSPDRIIYCTSRRLSEKGVDDITNAIRRHAPSGSVLTLGSSELAQLSERFQEIFEKYYPAESKEIRTRLLEPPKGGAEVTGLKLALATLGSDDAPTLRAEILERAVLEALAAYESAPAAQIAKSISLGLGLPRAVFAPQIERVLQGLNSRGLAVSAGGAWKLTEKGLSLAQEMPAGAAEALLAGRTVVRQALEALLGSPFDDLEFEQIWSSLLDFLCTLFYTKGLTVIRAIDQFLGQGDGKDVETANLREIFKDGAQRTASVAKVPERRDSIERAILDVFTERSGPAFDWLTRICERFVVLCCLGLESSSSEELRSALRRYDLVPDTDIVISYICEAEEDHDATVEVFKKWLHIGGRILLSPVVLEEVAYHASISERDFQETEHLLGKLQKHELRRYIVNAFVRAYHWWFEKSPKNWPLFISQFRGTVPSDSSMIQKHLRMTLGANSLPEADDLGIKPGVESFLLGVAAREKKKQADQVDTDDKFKIQRDARLVASVASARISEQRAGKGRSAVALSSSRWLRVAGEKFKQELGGTGLTMSIAAFSYLLAIIPEASLGAGPLRRALFEFGDSAHLSDTQRRALRIIRGTGEYDIPWATRILLEGRLNERIEREAKARDVGFDEVENEFRSGRRAETSAKLITDALRDMATGTTSQAKMEEAERKIQHLEDVVRDYERRVRKKTP